MRKRGTLMLCIILCFSLLTACSGNALKNNQTSGGNKAPSSGQTNKPSGEVVPNSIFIDALIHMDAGNYMQAYQLLKTADSNDTDAMDLLKKFALTPLKITVERRGETMWVDQNTGESTDKEPGDVFLGQEVFSYENSLFECSYDESGNLLKATYNNAIYLTCLYNESGKMLMETVRPDGNDSKQRITVNDYDEDGNVLSRTVTTIINGQESVSKTSYTYDENGKLIRHHVADNNLPTWEESYTYDHAGNLLTKIIDSYQNGSLFSRKQYTYTYDEHGNRLTEELASSTATWHKYTHTYDTNNHVTTTQFCSDETNGDIFTSTFTYDRVGNKLSKVTVNSVGEVIEQTAWSYNEVGNILTESYANSSDEYINIIYDGRGNELLYECSGIWSMGIAQETRKHVYNESGNLLSYTHIKEGQTEVTKYTYNAKGNVLTADRTVNEVLVASLAWKYNEIGMLSSVSYTSADFQESFVWNYDRNQNISSIRANRLGTDETIYYAWQLNYYPNGVPENVTNFMDGFYESALYDTQHLAAF